MQLAIQCLDVRGCELRELYAGKMRYDVVSKHTPIRNQSCGANGQTCVVVKPPFEEIAQLDALRFQEEPVELGGTCARELVRNFSPCSAIEAPAALPNAFATADRECRRPSPVFAAMD